MWVVLQLVQLVQRHLFPLQRKRMGSSVSNSTVFILASSSKVCSSDQPDTVLRWSPIQVLTHHFVLAVWQTCLFNRIFSSILSIISIILRLPRPPACLLYIISQDDLKHHRRQETGRGGGGEAFSGVSIRPAGNDKHRASVVEQNWLPRSPDLSLVYHLSLTGKYVQPAPLLCRGQIWRPCSSYQESKGHNQGF